MILWCELMVNHLRGPFLVAQRFCFEFCREYINTEFRFQESIGLWSNSNELLVLLISDRYLYAASIAQMRRESPEVVPSYGFERSDIYI